MRHYISIFLCTNFFNLFLTFKFRWVENKKVTEHLLQVWDDMKQLFAYWEKLPKSRRSSSKSYETVKKAIVILLISKLHFFAYVSGLVEPFVTLFQTGKLMIPFMYLSLKELVLKLLQIIVKPNVLESCRTGCKLKTIDLKSDENLLPLDKINAGFAVLDAVEKLKRKNVVSTSQIKNFMKDIRKFIIAMLEKIFEKSILGFSLVRAVTIFNPDLQLELSMQKLIYRLKVLLKHLMTLSICDATQCDQVPLTSQSFIKMN